MCQSWPKEGMRSRLPFTPGPAWRHQKNDHYHTADWDIQYTPIWRRFRSKHLNLYLTTVNHLYYSTELFYFIVKLLLIIQSFFASLSLMKCLWIWSEHHSDSSPQLLSSSRKCLKGFSIHRGSQEQLRVTGSHWPWPEQSSKHTAQICHSEWQWG